MRVSDAKEAMRSPARAGRARRDGLPDLEDGADEHAAAAGDRIMLLAALRDGPLDVRRHALGVALLGLRDLAKRGRHPAELSVAIGAAVCGFLRGRNFAGMCRLAPQFARLPFPWYSNWAVRLGVLWMLVLAIVAGLWRGRNLYGVAWLLSQLAVVPFPWYAPWGLTYVLDNWAWFATFLALLPGFSLLLDYNYDAHSYGWIAVSLVAFLAVANLRLERRSHGAAL